MHKKWLFSGLVVIFLAANLFYWLPVMADPSVCSEGFKCFFNDEGSLFFKSSSSTSDFLYLNYIGSNAYGLAVSATGELYHDGVSVVVADGGTYGLNISGSSNAIAIKSAQVAPDGAIKNSQSSFNSQDQSYLDSTVGLPVYGFYSNYHNDENRVSSQLALVIEGDATGGNQYLQFRFNDPADSNNWGIWHEVCDLSNNCRNLVNYNLDDTASNSLVMYGDPDILFDSGLKIGSDNLSDCGSLNTVGGVIGCGVAGGGGGVAGSGTINYLPKWSNTSTLANSLIYDNGTNVGVGDSNPTNKLSVNGTVSATTLKSNVINCSNGLKTDPTGTITCNTNPFLTTDQYWTGTATNLVSSTARASLGLGSLATLSAVSGGTAGTISDGTITNVDISGSAAIAASKIENGTYFINSSGTSGQVWTSDGSGAGNWVALAAGGGGGVAGSGTINYLPKWSNTSTLANSLIYDNGTNVGIGTTAPGAKLDVSGNTNIAGLLSVSRSTYPVAEFIRGYDGGGTAWVAKLQVSGTAVAGKGAGFVFRAPTNVEAERTVALFGGGVSNLATEAGHLRFAPAYGGVDPSGRTDMMLTATGANSGDSILSIAGKVGIGTTSPAYKLTVVGTGYFSNPVIVGTPTQTDHAATKDYVDATIAAIATHTPLTLANIGSTPNAQGASLSDQALTLQPANASFGGIVTTGSQTFAGTKTFSSTIQGNISGTAAKLAANGSNCSSGYYPLGVNEKGDAEDCTLITGGGTYTADGNGLELVGNSFRLELNGTTLSTSSTGLKVNAIGSTEISDGAIANADISGLAAISASKIQYGTYFINSPGTSGQVWTSDGNGAGAWSAASTIPANNITGSTAGTLNYIPKYTANYTLANSLIYDNGTNVGIGTTSSSYKLTVAGTVSFDNNKITSNGSGDFSVSSLYDKDNNSYYLNPAGATSINVAGTIRTEDYFFTQNGQYLAQKSSTTNPTFSWAGDNDTGLFRKTANTVALTTNGGEKFSLDANGKAIFTNGSVNLMTIEYSAGLSGALVTIGNGGTSKLDVGTVDPIYTIGGQKYATYMAGMVGVKEETSGALVLNKQSAGLFMAKLDFQNVPTGSDIWLFGRTTNLIDNQEHFDQTSCLLTPNFAGQAWYEKDWDGRSINIFARPDNVNRASVEVSYRLTAPRFDYQQWTNYSSSEHEGFNLDKLLQ